MTFPRTSTRPLTEPTRPRDSIPTGFRGKDGEIEEWNRTLTAQASYMLAQDLALYHSLPSWHSAESVLELGCGNGAHLHMVSETFPDKRYLGLDLSQPLLDIAANENQGPQLSYRTGDLLALDPNDVGRFDFIIGRFLVQHLQSTGPFLMRCSQLLNPGGTLLVYDAHDEATFLYPEITERVSLFRELARVQNQRSIGRQAVVEISRDAWRYGFAVTATRALCHVAVEAERKRELSDLFASIFTTIDRCMEVERDTKRTIELLQNWLNDPASFGQFGTRAVVLKLRQAGLYSLSRVG